MNSDMMDKVFPKEMEAIKNAQCPMCIKDINMASFRDSLSLREFRISGMCQKCQDEVFQ